MNPTPYPKQRPPKFGIQLEQVRSGLLARPGRTFLTVLGTVLGVAALVATLGIAETAGHQIVGHFDEAAATQVLVTSSLGSDRSSVSLPWDAQDRVERLNGVASAGTLTPVNIGNDTVTGVPVHDPRGTTSFHLPVFAASPGLFGAARTQVDTGKIFDQGHSGRADRVAVIGPGVAARLNIADLQRQPVLFVGVEPIQVIGVLSDIGRLPDLFDAVIVPEGMARALWGIQAPLEVHIAVNVGAANSVASEAPIALVPNHPDLLQVIKPPEPDDLRRSVQSDINMLFVLLGATALVVGAIGIANVTLVSVIERTGEIGLRRALGATRGQITLQFLMESTITGFVGGILGSAIGVVAVAVVALSRTWTPVIHPSIPIVAAVAGALTGLVAGLYPSIRAANLQPVEALRSA